MTNGHRPTIGDLERNVKLVAASERITAADILAWCDRNLKGEQDYNATTNVSAAKRVIEQAVKELCK